MKLFPGTRCLLASALLLVTLSEPALAIDSCEKDGEIVFTRECLDAMKKRAEEQKQATSAAKAPLPGSASQSAQRTTPPAPEIPATTASDQPGPKTPTPVRSSSTASASAATPQADPAAEKITRSGLQTPGPAGKPDPGPSLPAEPQMPVVATPAARTQRDQLPVAGLQPQRTIEKDPASVRTPARQLVMPAPVQRAAAITGCKAREFLMAAERGELALLRRCSADPALLEALDIRPGSRGRTALHWAVAGNQLAAARVLLGAGSALNLRSRTDMGGYPVHIAAENGNTDMLQLLLSSGASVAASDLLKQTPLHRAARNGNIDAVKLLLDKGASGDAQDRVGRTVLISASQSGNLPLVRLLINRGSDVNAQTIGGMSALHYAAARSRRMMSLLLDAGAEINPVNSEGQTPLATLISMNVSRHWERIKYLIERGASLDVSDMQGQTALDVSLATNHLPLFRLLLDRGADTSQLQLHQLKGKHAFVRTLQEKGIL